MIAYDISDHRARRRVEHTLLDHATRVQESVCEGFFSHAELRALQRQLTELLDTGADSLRCYPLCAWCREGQASQGSGLRTETAHYWVI